MSQQPLTRDPADRILGGVCAGLSARYGYDASLVRVVAVLLALISMGLGAVLYLVAWVLIPLPEAAGQPAANIARTNANEVVDAARRATRDGWRAARVAVRHNDASHDTQDRAAAQETRDTRPAATARSSASSSSLTRKPARSGRGFTPPRSPLPPSRRSGPPST
jgi:phage shock protein PspC (stress-responsive transcriptional regulator)